MHQARWQTKGHAGAFSDSRFGRFQRAFALEALRRGTLRLSTLEVDGATRAVDYGFQAGARVLSYMGAFDEEWAV